MTSPEFTAEEKAIIRRLRWRIALSWVGLAVIFALYWMALFYLHWPFPIVYLVLWAPGYFLGKWRRQLPELNAKPPSWRSWGLWIFLAWAAFIFISGFYLSPEHHRYTWVPLFFALGIWFIVMEIHTFWTAGKSVREADAPHKMLDNISLDQ